MKQIRIITAVFTALMLAVLFVGLALVNSLSFRRQDISEYNDRMYGLVAGWQEGVPAEELGKQYGCRIILSTELVDAELTPYYANGALVLDFAPEGAIIGKVVWDDVQETWKLQEGRLRTTLLVIWGLVAAAGYGLIVLIRQSVVKQIGEFEGFAEAVAKGHLDVQLPRHRLNLFGNFTESFDIMREELRNAREREVQANKAKREMVAGLATTSRRRWP